MSKPEPRYDDWIEEGVNVRIEGSSILYKGKYVAELPTCAQFVEAPEYSIVEEFRQKLLLL